MDKQNWKTLTQLKEQADRQLCKEIEHSTALAYENKELKEQIINLKNDLKIEQKLVSASKQQFESQIQLLTTKISNIERQCEKMLITKIRTLFEEVSSALGGHEQKKILRFEDQQPSFMDQSANHSNYVSQDSQMSISQGVSVDSMLKQLKEGFQKLMKQREGL